MGNSDKPWKELVNLKINSQNVFVICTCIYCSKMLTEMCVSYLVFLCFLDQCETELCRNYCTNKGQVCRLSNFVEKNFTVEKSRCSREMTKYWQFCRDATINMDRERVTPRRAVIGWNTSWSLSSTRLGEGQEHREELESCLVCVSFNTIWRARERAPIRSFSSSSKSNLRSKGFSSWCIIWQRFAG